MSENVVWLPARHGAVATAVADRLWMPDPTEPELAAWWRPLLQFGRRARADRVPWPVDVDEFHFVGCVRRAPRPTLWLYRHQRSGGEIIVTATGLPHRYLWARNGRGRFVESEVRREIHAAGLPSVTEPEWFSEDVVPGAETNAAPVDDEPHRHLRLV